MSRPQASENDEIVRCTIQIVKGYVAGNRLPPEALAALITTVSRALRSAPHSEIEPAVPQDAFVGSDRPRVQAAARALTRKEIAASIHETFLVCFEDGKPYRMLNRHLRLFGLTPDAYRAKWGLPDDYPMMPAFDMKHRAELARQRKLGKYDRSTAKPRKAYVLKAKATVQHDGTPAKPKASSTDPTRRGWRRQGEMTQTAWPPDTWDRRRSNNGSGGRLHPAPPRDALVAVGVREVLQKIAVARQRRAPAQQIALAQLVERAQQ